MEYSERVYIRDFVLDYLIEDGGVLEDEADRVQAALEAGLDEGLPALSPRTVDGLRALRDVYAARQPACTPGLRTLHEATLAVISHMDK